MFSRNVVFANHGRILFQQYWSDIKNFDQKVVNIVLEVDDLLALAVELFLEIDHHLDEVLPGLPVVLGEDRVRE